MIYNNRNKPAPFTIQQGIPIKRWKKTRAKPQIHVGYPFALMYVGDSFGASLRHKARISAAATAHARRHLATRFTVLRTGPNSCRCWRVDPTPLQPL